MDPVAVFGFEVSAMDKMSIFGTQFVLSIIAYSLIARWLFGPWLGNLGKTTALMILLVPHAFRHLGLAFLVPGLVQETIPPYFAVTAGYGDLLSALLAIAAIIALKTRSIAGAPLLIIFSIVGMGDLFHALPQADAVPHFISTWYIPTFIVPMLLVTHVMIIARFFKRDHE